MRSEHTMAAKREALRRTGMLRRLALAFCAAGLVAACGVGAHAQSSSPVTGEPGSVRGFSQDNSPFAGGDEVESVEAERRLNALNAERQKALLADTARLLKLAAELNQEIAKSNTGELTADQLRMVAEIEKLAHSVRDKMAMSLRGPQFPGMESPLQPFPQSSHH
jgi:hypothetical protein